MNRISSVLVLAATATAALALGCGEAPASVPGLPSDFTGPGTYMVPAVPRVEFAISHVDIEQADGTITVYYDLPAELAGHTTRVELTGAPDDTGAIQLSGAAGTSTCTVSATLRCEEHLWGLLVYAPQEGTPRDNPRLAAAQAFMADPIGILSVPLPH